MSSLNSKDLIDKLYIEHILSEDELLYLISNHSEETANYAAKKASEISKSIFGNDIYIRGLIEFTNICKNNCYYCGIRADNSKADRYRLSKADILGLCDKGYILGFRTFVLQGGEDTYFDDDTLCDIISSIKDKYADCAITLSVGERSYISYKRLYDAGADRYLLRHETADYKHYNMLHPSNMSLDNRKHCLSDLMEIGYQVGAGFMVGSPYQTVETIVKDLLFLKQLNPHMVGIGPFISHRDTPFKDMNNGSVELTIYLISLIRLLLPKANIPATTALSTLDENGREKGILAGANVVMPNLSPEDICRKYNLYDNKIYTGDENADMVKSLSDRIGRIGYRIAVSRGDSPMRQ